VGCGINGRLFSDTFGLFYKEDIRVAVETISPAHRADSQFNLSNSTTALHSVSITSRLPESNTIYLNCVLKMSTNTKSLVLLTGATGFVGAHVFAALLPSYRIKATIRSASKGDYLSHKYPSQKSDITFTIIPDLQAPGALDSAVQDVDYIIHLASPYFTATNDPIRELVEPAVNGTKNVITSALKAPRLKKMVVLSSFSSVVDLPKNPRPGYTYTEKDWDPVTPEQAAENGFIRYHASQTFAERAAWDYWSSAKEKGDVTWDLSTLCPPMIYGPPIHEVPVSKGIEGLNTSVQQLVFGLEGKDPAFAPKVSTPGLPQWIDVRDVAKACLSVLRLEKGVAERFLLCSSVKYYEDGLERLRAEGTKGLGEVGQKCDPNNHFAIDVFKAKTVLGLEFVPFEKTVEDIWEQMRNLGFKPDE
jgi:nucleoside-diphosphate-sugar epimerase